MLYDPARHEPLASTSWDEARARAAIERIVRESERAFSPASYWPSHPKDTDGRDREPEYFLYCGAAGVIWALHYLQAAGAARLSRDYAPHVSPLIELNRRRLRGGESFNAYLMGDTSILMLRYALAPDEPTAAALHGLIAGNRDNPTRELMWGSPGTMLAAAFLHERTGEERWAELFRADARHLRSRLRWSAEHECHYWTQDMYGEEGSYLDAVHGFAATASVLIRGRHLLEAAEWREWQECIANTIRQSATREGALANWRAWLLSRGGVPLVQFCHGAPGFVICLAGMPGDLLDDLLVAGGETTWQAGPLAKGSNLCHGTGGNGYAFLKLHRRTGDARWLERARAFAMHGIGQFEADAARYGQLRHSLWTGDPGLAIYLWDCIHGKEADFPTLDAFFW